MDISIIIPFLDESESLPELTEWIERVVTKNHFSYEIVMIDDGSTDNSWHVVEELRKKKSEHQGHKISAQLWKISSPE